MTKAQAKIKAWRENPVQFVNELFGVEPDTWQRKVLEIFPSMDDDKMRISLQACAGPGKTAVLSWCGLNFLSCYAGKGQHPKGAAVSVNRDNLKDNLWPEFSRWMGRSEFLRATFEWTKERIYAKEHPETWFISARSFAKSANAEEIGRTLSGLHSEYVLYLIDESGDISPSILKSAEQGLSTRPKFGKILQAGNPTSRDGMLYAAATTLRDQWHVVKITGDPDDPDRSPRIDIDWARKQIEQHGRTDPWVMAYILGQFPQGSINTLLTTEEVDAAMSRAYHPTDYQHSQKRLGIDCARFGLDSNIIFPRQGLQAFQCVELRGVRSNEVAARAMKAKADWGSEMEFVDGTGGYGSGIIDSMIQGGASPIEVQFSARALDPRYFNKRSEIWFLMAEWVKRGGALPNDEKLKKELTAPTYSFQGGKFKLEEKDQIKERLKFSPDRADGLCLTFALPEMPSSFNHLHPTFAPKRIVSDFDPFDGSRG